MLGVNILRQMLQEKSGIDPDVVQALVRMDKS